MQYRLLYQLLWTRAASLWKNPSCDSRLCRYSPLISKRLWDHVLYLARFQVTSTCVIFTRSQISHVMYHVIFFDLSNNHVTSHVIDPDTRHPTLAFPLWNTDTITTLGRLPNWDVRLTSYLGNTPVWKLQNQDDWKTRWPDCDIRTSFLFSKWLRLPETWKEKADPKTGASAIYPKPMTPLLKLWAISNAHSIQPLNP